MVALPRIAAVRALAPALLLAGCGPAPATPKPVTHPRRVMSVNQCTDQIVLALLPPGRIASVSWLSRDAGASAMAAAAARVPVNHGLAEEVLAERPDLVVAGSFTTPALRAMLKRSGYPLVEVADAASIDDIRRTVRQIAAALGEGPRGEALIAAMDRRLATLAREPVRPVPVVAWDRSGFAAGPGTLYDALLTAAGARNLAVEPVALGYRRPGVEVLLRTDPALLVEGSRDTRAASLGDEVIGHRLVRRYWAGRTVFVPQAAYLCGTPLIADAAARLRARLRETIARTGTAGPIGGRR